MEKLIWNVYTTRKSCSSNHQLFSLHADSLKDSSRVPPQRAPTEKSRNLRRPITTDFKIQEVFFRPLEILRTVTARKWALCDHNCYQRESGAYKYHIFSLYVCSSSQNEYGTFVGLKHFVPLRSSPKED